MTRRRHFVPAVAVLLTACNPTDSSIVSTVVVPDLDPSGESCLWSGVTVTDVRESYDRWLEDLPREKAYAHRIEAKYGHERAERYRQWLENETVRAEAQIETMAAEPTEQERIAARCCTSVRGKLIGWQKQEEGTFYLPICSVPGGRNE